MKKSIPKLMKALCQDEANGSLYVAEVPVPIPAKGQVLVKMGASPLNPSDLSFLKGSYTQQPKYPVIPGIEGSGTVVASGGGILANMRMGKRVTCSASEGLGGTWAEYMLTSAMRVIPIKKSIDMEQGAMLIVNPMTALAFMDIAREGKHKAIVNTASASVLGRMMIMLCRRNKLPLINIVRRQEQVELLRALGARYVLNSSEADFESTLKKLCHELKATLFLDAVAGDQSSTLLAAAPKGSTVLLYSNLSEQNIQVDPRVLIQGDKSIDSFYLGIWASKRSILQTLRSANRVQAMVGDELKSGIKKRFPMHEAQQALEYYMGNMTGGKTLLILDATMK